MKNDNEGDCTTTFLSLLFGICTGTLVFLLIPIYVPAGFRLPASLPIAPTPAHYELSFKYQIVTLALCTATILLCRLIGLWIHDSEWFKNLLKIVAAILLILTLFATGSAGWKIINDPSLLRPTATSLP